ncbi:MAG: hypothetical protein JWP88_1351 [Flaviaesturariibacter sp.]|nr:hypothetical protein [Flaviaesturariibacter sp.]
MNPVKKQKGYASLSTVHRERLQAMLSKLSQLPGTEASLSAAEVCFYELLTLMKEYTDAEGSNAYLAELEAIRHAEHEKCRDRFVSINIRNNAVRLFKNKLQHIIAGWLEA